MKKFEVRSLLALLLAAIMVFAMVACGGADDTLPVDDDTTDPVVTDPPATDPVVTDPPATDPVVTDPPVTDPVETDPPTVEPTVTGCTHGFGYNADVTAEVTDTGIVYKCKACGGAVVRAVTVGNGSIIAVDNYPISMDAGNEFVGDLSSAKDSIFGSEITDSAFMSFDMNISEFEEAKFETAADKVASWIIWRQTNELVKTDDKVTSYGSDKSTTHLIRVQKNDDKYNIWLGGSSGKATTAEIKLNTTHRILIEFDPVNKIAYLYMDGEYIDCLENFKLLSGSPSRICYTLQLNNGVAAGVFSNFKLYNPESDEVAESICIHFPDVTKELSKTITVENGVIKQDFTCLNCGKDVHLDVMNKITDSNFDSYLASISASKKIEVGNRIGYGTAPYIISFDLEIEAINVTNVSRDNNNGAKGRMFLSIAAPYSGGTGYTNLLRIYGCRMDDLAKAYGCVDANGDGFADDVVDFRCPIDNDIENSESDDPKPNEKPLGVGDSINITYVIEPTRALVEVYVDGVHSASLKSVNTTISDSMYIKVGDANCGSYSFKNFTVVRMSDK